MSTMTNPQDTDRVMVRMPGYIADGLAAILSEESVKTQDQGWLDLAIMLRIGGRDAEVQVTRVAS